MAALFERCQMVWNELIDITGRVAIRATLRLSAAQARCGRPSEQGTVRIKKLAT